MGFCFSFGSESLAIVFCRGSLGVTDCVRPGVATFFIRTVTQVRVCMDARACRCLRSGSMFLLNQPDTANPFHHLQYLAPPTSV